MRRWLYVRFDGYMWLKAHFGIYLCRLSKGHAFGKWHEHRALEGDQYNMYERIYRTRVCQTCLALEMEWADNGGGTLG